MECAAMSFPFRSRPVLTASMQYWIQCQIAIGLQKILRASLRSSTMSMHDAKAETDGMWNMKQPNALYGSTDSRPISLFSESRVIHGLFSVVKTLSEMISEMIKKTSNFMAVLEWIRPSHFCEIYISRVLDPGCHFTTDIFRFLSISMSISDTTRPSI